MRAPLLKKLNNSKGFTLAETLVALAITVILLGITMLGIIGYVKNMKITEMDSTARQIFSAAQNHLTSAQVTGQLNNSGSLGNIMTAKPTDFPKDGETSLWPGENNWEYYYIAYSPKDNATQGNLESSILKNMLPFGAIDEEVRKDGSYIIEYNIKTATVYGVFYTDNEAGVNSADVATINGKNGRTDGFGRVVRRDHEKDGKRVTIGYYGGAMAQELEGEGLNTPLLEIDNGEKLILKINDTNYFRKVGGKQLQTKVKVTVTGDESGKVKTFDLNLTGGPSMPTEGTSPGLDAKRWKVETKTDDETKTKYLAYEIYLDDITTVGGHFVNVCKGLTPGENITVDVLCTSDTVAGFEMKDQGKKNSLFEKSETTDNGVQKHRDVTIGAIRHFENLEPKVSKINENNTLGDAYVKTATQTKDLDWNTFHNTTVEKKSIYSHNGAMLAKESFYGIHAETLEKYDGTGKAMRNFVIKPEETDGETMAGLFQSISPYGGATTTISNMKLEGFDVMVQNVTGNQMTPTSNAKLAAGALVARIDGYAETVNIYNVIAVDGNVTSRDHAAGGLIGEIQGGNVDIKDCAAAMTVSGRGFAGGFIGGIEGGTVTVNNSYSSGRTKDGAYDRTTFNVTGKTTTGGFIGHVAPNGKLNAYKCYSTSSVNSNNHQAGGFVGMDYSTSSTYNDCYTTGLVKDDGSSGTFAYSLSALRTAVTNCRYLKGINGAMLGVKAWNTQSTGLIGVSYAELSKGVDNSLGETYAYDIPFYTEMDYPFPMVTTAGAKKTENKVGVHYGDWPKNTKIEELIGPTKAMFAYQEEYWQSPSAKWYVKGVDDTGQLGVVYNNFGVGYVESGKQRPSGINTQYGLLIATPTWSPSLFNKGSGKDVFSETYNAILKMNGKDYYFFPLLQGIDNMTDTTPVATAAVNLGNGYRYTFVPKYAGHIGVNPAT